MVQTDNIQGIIFDLDGVLVDKAKYHSLAWKRLAEELGFLFTEEDILDRRREYLQLLHKKGLKVGLGSASKNAKSILQKLKIYDLFDAIVDGEQINHTKPDSEVFEKCAEAMGLPFNSCLVIKDLYDAPFTKNEKRYLLETTNETIIFDQLGRICSFRVKAAYDQEMIQYIKAPAIELQYLKDKDIYQLTADDAKECIVEETENEIRFTYKQIGNRNIDIETRAFIEQDTIKMTLEIRNGEKLPVCQIRFPVAISRYQLDGRIGSETILRPYHAGQLIEAPSPKMLEADCPYTWMLRPENTNTGHYPGQTFAQFLAYYNDRAGIYAACDDTDGNIKVIKPVHRNGIRLGFQHVADWREKQKLGYCIILKGFVGDCYDAADIYREWFEKQTWAKPIKSREDIPQWLLELPFHVIFRIQGEVDAGPAKANDCFLPFEKNIPRLKEISERLESPVLPVIMGWEKNGPWVYPDCFPITGGEDSLKKFRSQLEELKWHLGTYSNGTRWVIGHYWSGYDGRKYLEEEKGRESFCRTLQQQEWKENWDSGWRESFACCIASSVTKGIAAEFQQKMLEYGVDYIQFLDQNVGCASFPCYSDSHGHVPMPDIWMTEEMEIFLNMMKSIEGEKRGEVVTALEQPCCEFFIPHIHICDVRPIPPGHSEWKKDFFPLYQYLFHEYILLQGTFGKGADPFHMRIKSAWNFVLGNLDGGILGSQGEFVDNLECYPWAVWKKNTGDQEKIIQIIKNLQILRRGSAKEFLAFGRMERPVELHKIPVARWEYENKIYEIPKIFHSFWKAPDGRNAAVFANWTEKEQTVTFSDKRLSSNSITITIPPLNGILKVEEKQNGISD